MLGGGGLMIRTSTPGGEAKSYALNIKLFLKVEAFSGSAGLFVPATRLKTLSPQQSVALSFATVSPQTCRERTCPMHPKLIAEWGVVE